MSFRWGDVVGRRRPGRRTSRQACNGPRSRGNGVGQASDQATEADRAGVAATTSGQIPASTLEQAKRFTSHTGCRDDTDPFSQPRARRPKHLQAIQSATAARQTNNHDRIAVRPRGGRARPNRIRLQHAEAAERLGLMPEPTSEALSAERRAQTGHQFTPRGRRARPSGRPTPCWLKLASSG